MFAETSLAQQYNLDFAWVVNVGSAHHIHERARCEPLRHATLNDGRCWLLGAVRSKSIWSQRRRGRLVVPTPARHLNPTIEYDPYSRNGNYMYFTSVMVLCW